MAGMRTILGFTLFIALLPAYAAPDNPQRFVGRLLEVRTPQARLLTNSKTISPELFARKFALFREALQEILPELSQDRPTNPPLTLLMLREESFRYYAESIVGAGQVYAATVVSPDADYLVLNVDNTWVSDIGTLYQTYLVYLLRGHREPIPAWFTLGMKRLLETAWADDKGFHFGHPKDEDLDWFRKHDPIPFSLFLRDHLDEQSGARTLMFQAQSWAFVHYLVIGSTERRDHLRGFLRLLRSGRTLEQSLRDSFGAMGLETAEQLTRYAGQLKLPELTIPASVQDGVVPQTAKLSAADSLAEMGLFLIRAAPKRRNDADAHFREALKLDPKCRLALDAVAGPAPESSPHP